MTIIVSQSWDTLDDNQVVFQYARGKYFFKGFNGKYHMCLHFSMQEEDIL